MQIGDDDYLTRLADAVRTARPVLLENVSERLDPALEPLLARAIQRRGKQVFVTIGQQEVPFDPAFRLFLQTRRANPHFKPEVQAQTTLINFMITPAVLEEQLLAHVARLEMPELEAEKEELMRRTQEARLRVGELEDELLKKLSDVQGDILEDSSLVDELAKTKATTVAMSERVAESLRTEARINAGRELYRVIAARAALLYFLLQDLQRVEQMYQYSLGAFTAVMDAAFKSTIVVWCAATA